MTSITFYGGAGEIGGNKILLKDKNAKIYLDFGESFDFGEDYFYGYLEPRNANGLEVYFEFGLLPKLSMLYSETLLKRTNLKYEKSNIDGVLLSHSHSDHVGHVPFLDENIPVYLGHGTHKLIEAYGDLYPKYDHIGDRKNINHFSSGKPFKIKHLEITPIHVEHSVPGAYGFIIKTSKGNIVYTGDFRIHGPRADMTKEFVRKAKKAKPYVLICEGTRMEREVDHNFTEEEVGKKVSGIISKSKGAVFAYFAMSNVDRFMSFYNAAVKNKRILVIPPHLAHIISRLRDKIKVLPDVMKDRNIRVYYRLSKSCTFAEKDYYIWEREFWPKKITYKEIKKNPKKYVMHMNLFRLMELVYIQPKKADFIYSSSEHFLEGEGKEEEKEIWENWMKHFGINFPKAHCSGHASKQDLIKVIKEINPNILIPVHTSKPEEFKKYHKNVILPQKGKEIKL